MQQATLTQEAEVDPMSCYLQLVCHVLAERLGGDVVITPEELTKVAERDAQWERVGRNYRITIER